MSNAFKRRTSANGGPEQTDGPSTPRLNKRVTNGQGQVMRNKSPDLRARLKQPKLDLSMLPAGASSSTQPQLSSRNRHNISSPIHLDNHSAGSCDDDIVPATARRRRVEKSAIAISSDDSEARDSGLESPPRSTRRVTTFTGNVHNSTYNQSRPQKAPMSIPANFCSVEPPEMLQFLAHVHANQ